LKWLIQEQEGAARRMHIYSGIVVPAPHVTVGFTTCFQLPDAEMNSFLLFTCKVMERAEISISVRSYKSWAAWWDRLLNRSNRLKWLDDDRHEIPITTNGRTFISWDTLAVRLYKLVEDEKHVTTFISKYKGFRQCKNPLYFQEGGNTYEEICSNV
jgi:hypothetical protein